MWCRTVGREAFPDSGEYLHQGLDACDLENLLGSEDLKVQ